MSHTRVVKINLLPGASRLQIKAIRYRKHNKIISFILVALWIASAILVFSWQKVVEGRLAEAEKRLTSTKGKYAVYKDLVSSSAKLKSSARQVSAILDNRFEYAMAFENFDKLFDKRVKIENFELKGTNQFDVSLMAPTYELAKYVENLVMDIKKNKYEGFNDAEIDSFTWELKNGWLFSLKVKIV